MSDPPNPRRARRGLLVALAAVTVVLAIAVPTFLHQSSKGHSDGGLKPDPGAAPADWRTESYAGVQVAVPARFGWGSSPRPGARWCGGDRAAVTPGRLSAPRTGSAYVGRPIPTTDVCTSYDPKQPAAPLADSVWFDSPLPVGERSLGGYRQMTIAVGKTHVSAAARDPRLVERVLATARTVDVDDNGCASTPEPRLPSTAPEGPAESLSVCAYDGSTLVWSTRKDAATARAFEDAFQAGSATFDAVKICRHDPNGRFVALGVVAADATRWYTAELGCGQLLEEYTSQDGPSRAAAGFTEATVAPWGGDGLRAYVGGPGTSGVERYFRSLQG